jgi:hypothetical protein
MKAALDPETRQGFIFTNNYNQNELIAFTFDENPSEGMLRETSIAQILDVAFNL